jgi:uncharacterized membrane protein YdbT with pleckstrin-like domain
MTIPAPVATAFSSLLRLPPPPDPPPGDEATAIVFRASRKYLAYRTTGWAILAAVLLAAAAMPLIIAFTGTFATTAQATTMRQLGLAVLAAAAALLVVVWMLLRLDYAWRWYVVTDRSLRIREGVWHVREMTVTFANVQNLSIEQGPVQRFFGISDVRVDTAGGGGATAPGPGGRAGAGRNLHTAWLRGLDNAAEVRTAIQQRLRGRLDAGLGDPEESDPSSRSGLRTLSPEALWAAAEILAEARALHAAARGLAETGAARSPSLP